MSAPQADPATERTRRVQQGLLAGLAVAALGGLALWLSAGGSKPSLPEGGIAAELAGPGTAEASWVRRSEARIGGLERRLREMETQARRVDEENARLRTELRARDADARAVIDRQAALIESMERRASAPPDPFAGAGAFPGGEPFAPASNTGQPSPTTGAPAATAPTPLIESFPLEGAAPPETFRLMDKTLGTWLPAGSHAEAVVIAGVDASAGIVSQSDPRPVLLRITSPAWTAAEAGEALEVDLEGCTVTGAAHGDLSSEKVYVRLRTLTCAGEAPGAVVETEVAGFVAGAGKTGVRGPVVSREGALVEKAFLAGALSGLGDGVSRAFEPQALATGPGTAAVTNTSLGDIARSGLGSGAGSAGRKVADYLIRRAEQYQPVIQLQAGTRVAVVFIEGARLDGREEDKTHG